LSGEAETRMEVTLQFWDCLDGSENLSINSLLISDSFRVESLLLWESLWLLLLVAFLGGLLGDDGGLVLLLLWLLGLLEVSIIELGNINTSDVNLGGCGNHVSLVNSLDWDTIDLVWSGDQEETRRKLLQENNTLSTETTGKKNDNSSGGDGSSQTGGF